MFPADVVWTDVLRCLWFTTLHEHVVICGVCMYTLLILMYCTYIFIPVDYWNSMTSWRLRNIDLLRSAMRVGEP